MTTFRVLSVDDIFQAIESLPGMPHAVADIIRTIDDDNTTSAMLAHKIEGDIGMLSDVLRLANSPRYAVINGVAYAQQAVVVLGFNVVRNLACMAGVFNYFRENSGDTFDFVQFARHSVGTACCAKLIAGRAKLNKDAAFVAGMLHDVGKLAAAVVFPDEYRVVMDYQALHDCDIAVSEQSVLGVDHAALGAHMLGRWSFPPDICEAIGGHHQLFDDIPKTRMADVLHVADVLSHALDFGGNGQVPLLNDSAMSRLGFSFPQLKPQFDEIEDEYCNYIQVLGV